MSKTFTEKREVEIKKGYDVIVAGGGIAGVSAALSSGRQGMSVLLIEKSLLLGGLATLGLVNWYEPLCDGEGNVMTTGIAKELLELSIKYGFENLAEQWKKGTEKKSRKRFATLFNPYMFALALNELMINEHIDVRYDMLCSFPVMEENICTGVIVESKNGRELFPCKILIDATGDADLAVRAGMPYREGENYLTYYGHGCTQNSIKKTLVSGDMVDLNASGFHFGSDLKGKGHPEGLPLFKGISNESISEYISTGQLKLLEKLKEKQKNDINLYSLPGLVQLRKTRCIVGDETFIGEDGKHFENSIGAVGDFRRRNRHYELPLKILYNKEFNNILLAGRIVSAQGDGWEIARVIPTAALTGQAAGIVAYHAVASKQKVSDVAYDEVEKSLSESGVKIHF